MLLVGKVDEEQNISVVVQQKNNLSQTGKSFAFRIDGDTGLEWLGDYPVTADELLSTKAAKHSGQLEAAKDFIRSVLSAGAASVAEIFELAEENDITRITLNRAKSVMRVKSAKVGKAWIWSLDEVQGYHSDDNDNLEFED